MAATLEDLTKAIFSIDMLQPQNLIDTGVGILAQPATPYPQSMGSNLAGGMAYAQQRQDARLRNDVSRTKLEMAQADIAGQKKLAAMLQDNPGLASDPKKLTAAAFEAGLPELGIKIATSGPSSLELIEAQLGIANLKGGIDKQERERLDEVADFETAYYAAYENDQALQELKTKYPGAEALAADKDLQSTVRGGRSWASLIGQADKADKLGQYLTGIPASEIPHVLSLLDTVHKNREIIGGGLSGSGTDLKLRSNIIQSGGNVGFDAALDANNAALRRLQGKLSARDYDFGELGGQQQQAAAPVPGAAPAAAPAAPAATAEGLVSALRPSPPEDPLAGIANGQVIPEGDMGTALANPIQGPGGVLDRYNQGVGQVPAGPGMTPEQSASWNLPGMDWINNAELPSMEAFQSRAIQAADTVGAGMDYAAKKGREAMSYSQQKLAEGKAIFSDEATGLLMAKVSEYAPNKPVPKSKLKTTRKGGIPLNSDGIPTFRRWAEVSTIMRKHEETMRAYGSIIVDGKIYDMKGARPQ